MINKIVILLLIVLFICLERFFLNLNDKYVKKGKYWKPLYSGKITIWLFPFYVCFIIIGILVIALFS